MLQHHSGKKTQHLIHQEVTHVTKVSDLIPARDFHATTDENGEQDISYNSARQLTTQVGVSLREKFSTSAALFFVES